MGNIGPLENGTHKFIDLNMGIGLGNTIVSPEVDAGQNDFLGLLLRLRRRSR